jgi:hypothetical protein
LDAAWAAYSADVGNTPEPYRRMRHEIEDAVLMYIRPILDNHKEALDGGEFRMHSNGVNFVPGDSTEYARIVVTLFARIQDFAAS